MSRQSTANIAIRNTVIYGAVAAIVATYNISYSESTEAKAMEAKYHEFKDKKKGSSVVGYKKENSINPARSFNNAIPMLVDLDGMRGRDSMRSYAEPVKASSVVQFPVKYQGKLLPSSENSFTFNDEREVVDLSDKIEKVAIKATYRGRLPVGRERM